MEGSYCDSPMNSVNPLNTKSFLQDTSSTYANTESSYYSNENSKKRTYNSIEIGSYDNLENYGRPSKVSRNDSNFY